MKHCKKCGSSMIPIRIIINGADLDIDENVCTLCMEPDIFKEVIIDCAPDIIRKIKTIGGTVS